MFQERMVVSKRASIKKMGRLEDRREKLGNHVHFPWVRDIMSIIIVL